MVTLTIRDEVDREDLVSTLRYWGLEDDADDPESFINYAREMAGSAALSFGDVELAASVKMFDLTGGLSAAV